MGRPIKKSWYLLFKWISALKKLIPDEFYQILAYMCQKLTAQLMDPFQQELIQL